MDQFFPVLRENATELADHTIYRPVDLDHTEASWPVVVFANGGCRLTNNEYIDLLTLVAAHGFVVVANGAVDTPFTPEADLKVKPKYLRDAIDWVGRANATREYHNRLDPSRIATFGQSCGGFDALTVGSDARVKSVISLNAGLYATPGKYDWPIQAEWLPKLHSPTLFIDGGPTDATQESTVQSYGLVTVPAVLAEQATAGHTNLFHDPQLNEQTAELVVTWLDATLNGNTAARSYFLGAGCGLCHQSGWTLQAKGF